MSVRRMPISGEEDLFKRIVFSNSDGLILATHFFHNEVLTCSLEYMQLHKKYFRERLITLLPNLGAIDAIEFYGLNE